MSTDSLLAPDFDADAEAALQSAVDSEAADRPTPPAALHWTAAIALTGVAYALAGALSLWLAVPPSYASALNPSAGVALVCVLLYGWRVVPAVALSAFGLNVALSADRGLGLAQIMVPAAIGLGAAAQALIGAKLVERFAKRPLLLDEPREIAAFFGWGALVACGVSASVATATLSASGAVPSSALGLTWLTWWTGDALGVLIAAPIALTLLGQPRGEWRPRRLTVGLPLAIVTVLLVVGILYVNRLDAERARNAFEREVDNAVAQFDLRMLEPLHALEAMTGLYRVSDAVSPSQHRVASQAWLSGPGAVQAVGWSQLVAAADVAGFEAAAQLEGATNYRVFNRTADGSLRPPEASDTVTAVRFIEPLAANAGALGLNSWSVPEARAALDRTRRTGQPAATAGFRLTQDQAGAPASGVVIYRAIYRALDRSVAGGTAAAASPSAAATPESSTAVTGATAARRMPDPSAPQTEAERMAGFRGAVFVTLRMTDIVDAVTAGLPRALSMCLIDTDPTAPNRRLAGIEGCEKLSAATLSTRTVSYAGRPWDLRVGPPAGASAGASVGASISASGGAQAAASSSNTGLFSAVGLAAAAMLGALLLTVTGRTRRIEIAVAERTAALSQEVQEREQAEQALRQSEERLSSIFNNMPIGVAYTDLQGNLKEVNPRFCELVGYGAAELLEMNSIEYTHPEDVAEELDLTSDLVRGHIPMFRWQHRYIRADGSTVWVQSTMSLLRDADGHARRILGAVEDITEHLKLADSESAREMAEAANRAKSDFLSRMSHELRTPLNAMLGFAQLLEMDTQHPLPDVQRPWVTQIQKAGWHLLDMINDVLDLSRIDSGNMKLELEILDFPEILSNTVPLVQRSAKKRGIQISQELAQGCSTVRGNGTRVKQILTNLLSNAVKYNTPNGRIHVATRSLGGMVEIAVTDTGLGMTPQQMSELFQPFNRLGRDQSSSEEGTGIGLVISQRLAELMGGSLRARSVTGEGSTFILALPNVIDPDTVRSDLENLSAATADYRQRIVHYVEDNETNVEVMRGILLKRPQVQLDVSIAGLDGLAAIRMRHPHVILLDMHLPDISGMELLRHLKADPATENLPVVVVSADAVPAQIEEALSAGALRYLTKPVDVNELLIVLDAVLIEADTRFG